MRMALLVLVGIFQFVICVFLARRLLRSRTHWLEKVGGCVLLVVPFAGPFLYFLVIEPPQPQPLWLQARGARGEYSDRWVATKRSLEETLSQVKKASIAPASQSKTDGDVT